MQTHLQRSRSEVILGGVGGGLAEYFGIDPLIPRLIFVILTFTSGVGLPLYLLFWVLMPRETLDTSTQPVAPTPQKTVRLQQQGPFSEPDDVVTMGRVVTTAPYAYAAKPSTGDTIKLSDSDAQQAYPKSTPTPSAKPYSNTSSTPHYQSYQSYQSPSYQARQTQQPRHNWRKLGFILIGTGMLFLLHQFGISLAIMIPALMIASGVVLMKRKP